MDRIYYHTRNMESVIRCPYSERHFSGSGPIIRVGSIGCRQCKYFNGDNPKTIDGRSINCLRDLTKFYDKREDWLKYYTKHRIKILPEELATKENYKMLAATIEGDTGYHPWKLVNGCINDSQMNNGKGTIWREIEKNLKDLSDIFPEFTIQVDCLSDYAMYTWDEDIYEPPYSYQANNGNLEYVESDEFIKVFDEDKFKEEYVMDGFIIENPYADD